MKLIQLPAIALEERIQEELEINPALEEATDQNESDDNTNEELNDNEEIKADDINVDEYLSDDEIPEYRLKVNNQAQTTKIVKSSKRWRNLLDHLQEQLRMRKLTEHERTLGEYLIGNIADDGYIRRSDAHCG